MVKQTQGGSHFRAEVGPLYTPISTDDPNTDELFARARKLSEENRKVGEALIRVLADKKRSSDERLEAAK